MAEGRFSQIAHGFSSLSPMRQSAIIVVLALTVTLGALSFFWSGSTSYKTLFGNIPDNEASSVIAALEKANIPYQLDNNSGSIKVPAKMIHEARIRLASEGLPKNSGTGFELMDNQSTFGISQFREKTNYQRAVQGELARTITSMRNIENARVHLAIPKESAFVRDKKKPSASIFVSLYGGRSLNEQQVASITNLVASSVPELENERVTIIDQKGNLLTGKQGNRADYLTTRQFELTRKLERTYTARIEEILSPITGSGGVKAQVTAELDFTKREQTTEDFSPEDQKSIRSEFSSSTNFGGRGPEGIPGAQSNQPGGLAAGETDKTNKSDKKSTINYELDKTISHTQFANGSIKKLSIAVVVAYKNSINGPEGAEPEALSDEEMARITSLAKKAVGFNKDRGDIIEVTNQPFSLPIIEPLPEIPIWQQPWALDLGKQLLIIIAGLVAITIIIKPLLKSLSTVPTPKEEPTQENIAQQVTPEANNYDQQLSSAKTTANQDPKVVAQVVKNWMDEDG